MKRITPTTVTVGMGAIAFGLVAAYLARWYLEPAPTPDTRVEVVVPALNLPKYSRLRPQDVETVRMPPEQVPEGAVTALNRALYRTTRDTVLAGEPITEELLYGVGETPKLADQLPPGYRAYTVSANSNAALGGLLLPESRVDISLTVNDDHPDLGGIATTTILRNVRVLATSQRRFEGEERLDPTVRNVTLAVTQAEANKLILAQRHGTLSFTLRSGHEADVAATENLRDFANDADVVNLRNLLGLKDAVKKSPVQVQVWKGTRVSAVTFNEEGPPEFASPAEVTETNPARPIVPASHGVRRPSAIGAASEGGDTQRPRESTPWGYGA